MAWWTPTPIWRDQACYIIGGGPSLEGFDWSLLRGRKVLGCNAAFYLGSPVCPITIFGDAKFLHKHMSGLVRYVAEGGIVVTNSSRLRRPPPPGWLHMMKKQLRGLATDALGWNGNTGASAINLALLFGASTVYLLGYDMKLSPEGKANYHNAYAHPPRAHVFKRFKRGMVDVQKDLPRLFPGRKVINLEDGTSGLDVFPKMSLVGHFAGRKVVA
jgi:hypothetical protein